jgi:DNA-binding CsgD family transcriptional regulator
VENRLTDAHRRSDSSRSELCDVISGLSEPDAVQALLRLLERLPVAVFALDRPGELKPTFENAAWLRFYPSEGLPIRGPGPVPDAARRRDVRRVLGEVCRRSQSVGSLGTAWVNFEAPPSDVTRSSGLAYLIADQTGQVTRVIAVMIPEPTGPDVNGAGRVRRSAGASPSEGPLAEEQTGDRLLHVLPRARRSATGYGASMPLTTRELDVARLVAAGLTNAVIASTLFLSRATVATHVSRILNRLDFKSRSQIAGWVVEQRLIDEARSS